MLTSFVSCDVTYVSSPSRHYNCYAVYDYYGFYLYDECYWEYYNQDGSMGKELDLVAEVADKEALILEKTASIYAEKFSLSTEQSLKVAKNVRDFSALSERTEDDIADFAQKMYGINPSKMASAVANAQLGENAQLDAVIEEAAHNWKISTDSMKNVIQELHKEALKESGISL